MKEILYKPQNILYSTMLQENIIKQVPNAHLFTLPKYSLEASGDGFMVGDCGCQLAGQTERKTIFL